MNKKPKYEPDYPIGPGLFDNIELPGEMGRDQLPVHPSIEEFVVNVNRQEEAPASAQTDTSESLDSPITGLKPRDAVFFISFGSGSCGNSAFVGDHTGGFLIDAGVDLKRVTAGLEECGFSMSKIKGIILTHDHSDHVHYVYTLVRRNPHIRVYCTPKVFGGIMRRHSISRRLKDYHHPIYKEFPFRIGAFDITAFEVSHDGTDNAGFHITRYPEDVRLTVATDLGCITDRVDYYMRLATHIVIEANYDAAMLANGPYPAHLKARIEAERGHLDNKVTAAYLASIASPRLKQVFLCHLSQDNNTPEIALDTVTGALASTGFPIEVSVLPRMTASTLFTLRL